MLIVSALLALKHSASNTCDWAIHYLAIRQKMLHEDASFFCATPTYCQCVS